MANKRSRIYLAEKFEDGDRPTGENFADLIESGINIVDDGASFDGDKNLTLSAGLKLSNVANGPEGTLRFNNITGEVEVFSGGTWNSVSGGGGGGAFTEVNGGPDVAFSAGNVGIATGATTPSHKLDVTLPANGGTNTRVRIGNLAIHNGSANDAMHLCHQTRTGASDFAVRQDAAGNTTLGASNNREVRVNVGTQNKVLVESSGVSIFGTLFVSGNITTTGALPITSDIKVKKNIKELQSGLKDLLKLKPVTFQYNGLGNTPTDDKEMMGLIAQDVDKIFPSLVNKIKTSDPGAEEILTYTPQPLLFVMINAIRELTERVEKLESMLQTKS